MENRRLAILSSHLLPIPSNSIPCISNLNCDSSSSSNHRQLRVSTKEILHTNCVFCNIIRGESPSVKLYEDDMCLCILDTKPLTHGHSLIIPKSHYSTLEETPPSVVAAMCSKVPYISTAIMKATECDSFNLLVNSGVAAGQVIFHTHIHIVPRRARDCLWTSESLQRRSLNLDSETSHLADCIREQLLSSNNSEDGEDQGLSLTRN